MAPNCKQPHCPSTCELVNKFTSPYIEILLFSISEKTELLINIMWIKLVGIMLSKRSQFQNLTYKKDTCYMIPSI